MTHPLTPREKVAQIIDPSAWSGPGDLTWMSRERWRREGLDLADAILTALASGSGDQLSGNPGILKSGDHEELIGVLRADRLPECSFDDGKTWELDGVGVAETFSRAADALDALLAENAALRVLADDAAKHSMRQTDKLLAMHDRATEAERKLAEATGLLRDVVSPGWTRDAWSKARTFLSKEAERG